MCDHAIDYAPNCSDGAIIGNALTSIRDKLIHQYFKSFLIAWQCKSLEFSDVLKMA